MNEQDLPFRKDELIQRRGDLLQEIAECADQIAVIDQRLKQN